MENTTRQPELFEMPQQLPHGLVYRAGFLSADEEAALLQQIRPLPFREARFREYFAKRRVVRFRAPERAGRQEADSGDDPWDQSLPPFLVDMRRRVAEWASGLGPQLGAIEPSSFVHALVSEYRPGTPIGWHRDKLEYGIVVGISLAGRGTMRFRPLEVADRAGATGSISLVLEPRSAYVMQGPIRWQWQHSMLPTTELRYSITFRTWADRTADAPSSGTLKG